MSEDGPVIDGVPPEYRHNYGGRCWWCGAVADSREHKHKKSDLIREFGSGPYLGDSAVVRGFDGTLRNVQGPDANEVRFPRVLCARCNNARSKPFDLAYDVLAAFIADHEDAVLNARQFRFSDVYGSGWRSDKDNLARYYVKHLGCRLAEAEVKVEQSILDYLNGQSAELTGLELRYEMRSDIVEIFRQMRSRYGDSSSQGLWIGDLFCRLSRSTGAISEIRGFLGYRWLRLNYFYTPGIRRPQGSFRRNRVKLPFVASVDPATVNSEMESS